MKELKKQYNAFLIRHNRAASFLDDDTIPAEEREQHIPAFRKIIADMEAILKDIKAKGHESTETEIMQGFKVRGVK